MHPATCWRSPWGPGSRKAGGSHRSRTTRGAGDKLQRSALRFRFPPALGSSGCPLPCALLGESESPGRGAVLPGAGREGRRSPLEHPPGRGDRSRADCACDGRPGGHSRHRSCDSPPGKYASGKARDLAAFLRAARVGAGWGREGWPARSWLNPGRGRINTCSPGWWRRGGFLAGVRGEGGALFKRPPPRGAGGGWEGRELPRGLTPARARRRRRETTRSGRPRLESWSRAPRVARTERCHPAGAHGQGPRGGASPPPQKTGVCVCVWWGLPRGLRPAAKRLLSASARLFPCGRAGGKEGE